MARTKGARGLILEEKTRIATLAASGLTPRAIGEELGRDEKTVAKYIKQPEAQIAIEEKKMELADKFEDMANRMLDSITEVDIKELSAYQRLLSSGIAVDKMRLLRDQSTENLSIQSIGVQFRQTLEQCRSGMQEIAEEMKRRGLPVPGGK